MVAQQSGRQYDDDLTVDTDAYDDTFSTDYVDLFEPLGDEDSPIAKLKTIVLSIDWEITDEILHQLNEELQDLKDVWAGDKINLIYIQALEKIGHYIFAEKANAHPNAIKLLLTFYYDLEKIVSSHAMDEEAKKQLLLQDVKKFEQFKTQIGPVAPQKRAVPGAAPKVAQKNPLTTLKAIVLGIDWEISDQELRSLGEEVGRLEKIFSDSRARLIFLQGIGALGSYIQSTKNRAHPDAFKLLHSFVEGLDRICNEELTSDQEKEILFAEVNRFNAFKAVIASVASEVVVPAEESAAAIPIEDDEGEDADEDQAGSGVITPAFADMPEGVHGFRADTEAARDDIDQRLASFFEDEEVATTAPPPDSSPENPEVLSRLDALFGEEKEEPSVLHQEVEPVIALEGVNVETEADDDSGERALLYQGDDLAPALTETGTGDLEPKAVAPVVPFDDQSVAAIMPPGLDVETEADDDSDEAPLPREQEGQVAPALMFSDEGYGFQEPDAASDVDFDLEERLDSFFGAEIEEAAGEDAHRPVDSLPDPEPLVTAFEPIPDDRTGVLSPSILSAGADAGKLDWQTTGIEEVVFEPVGDDVEVDEPRGVDLRPAGGLPQESPERLRQHLAEVLIDQEESVFSAFYSEAERLRQAWQHQYIKLGLLQLLIVVCRHVEGAGADAQSLTLLQSLGDRLVLVCRETNRIEGGRAKVLCAEMDRVLLWQQGLILSAVVGKRKHGETGTLVTDAP